MNKDLNSALEKAVIFGLLGAAGIPLAYEVFANISESIAWIALVFGAAFAGVKLSGSGVKNALLGFAVMFAMTAGLGIVGFMIIHPTVKSYLESHSKYFYVSLSESVRFCVRAAGVQLVVPVVILARKGLSTAVKKLKSNGEAAKSYIDNAFDDDDKKS